MATTRRTETRRNRSPRLRVLPPTESRLVRLPRVRSAKKRIESGYYDREDVRDRLADAVLDVILQD